MKAKFEQRVEDKIHKALTKKMEREIAEIQAAQNAPPPKPEAVEEVPVEETPLEPELVEEVSEKDSNEVEYGDYDEEEVKVVKVRPGLGMLDKTGS
jgi:hypothetical protein